MPHKGHAVFRERYGALWAGSPKLRALILNRTTMGRFVIDLEQLVGAADGDRPPLLAIYETADDTISRFWVLRHDS